MHTHRRYPIDTLFAWGLLFPAVVFVALFVVVPVIGTVVNSLFVDISFMPKQFNGLGNYVALCGEPDFHIAILFTVGFSLTAVLFETLFGLLFALVLNESFPGRGMLRAVVLIPWAIPTIVSAKIWKLIFDYSTGILNSALMSTGIIEGRVNWLGSASGAFLSLVVAEVWKTTPFVVLILLAGLQAIPSDLYHQAMIDGAGIWKRLTKITLPIIKPILIIAVIFRTIDSIRIFDLLYVLTGGGPGGTTTSLSLLGYEYFSQDRFGAGSAVSVVTFLLAMMLTLLYLKMVNFQESIQPAS